MHFSNGAEGTRLQSEMQFDRSLFTEKELMILKTVYDRFSLLNATQISSMSHDEDAWKDFVGKKESIDYSLAFSLKAV